MIDRTRWNKVYVIAGYFLLLVLSLLFSGRIARFADSPTYVLLNCFIFIASLIIFIVLLSVYLFKLKLNKKDSIIYSSVLIISIAVVYFILSENVWGRFSILRMMIGDVMIRPIYESTILGDKRSYALIIYSMLNAFGLHVTPYTLQAVNRVISVGLLMMVFNIAAIVFKKYWIAFFVLLTYIGSFWVQINLGSFDYIVGSLFFSASAIFFLLRYQDRKSRLDFLLSITALIIAVYFRNELCILLGVPYLMYYLFFVDGKSTWKWMPLVVSILLLNTMALIWLYSYIENPLLWGSGMTGAGFGSHIINSLRIFHHNVFLMSDFTLSPNVSLFTYTGLLLSAAFVIYFAYATLKKKQIEHQKIYLFAFYNLFFIMFQLLFAMDGLRAADRYSIQYFICEIVITYYAIWLIFKRMKFKRIGRYVRYLYPVAICVMLIAATYSSGVFNYGFDKVVASEAHEFIELTQNVDIDESCHIIKINVDQPQLDFYFGMMDKAIYFGRPPEFYSNIKRINKDDKCFYFLDQRYLTERDILYKNRNYIDMDKVFESFKGCTVHEVYEGTNPSMLFLLIRFDC